MTDAEQYVSTEGPRRHVLVTRLGSTADKLRWTQDGKKRERRFAHGDLILNPAGLSTNPHWNSDARLVLLAIDPLQIVRFAEQTDRRANIKIIPNFGFRDRLLRELTANLAQEFAQEHVPDRVYAETLLQAAFAQLARLNSAQGDPTDRRVKDRLSPGLLYRCTEFLDAHLDKSLSLQSLADIADLSPSHFVVLFQNATGQSPHQFVMEKRIERAAHLLRNTTLPVTEVSMQTGFADQSHLTRTFRERMGTTPARFRKQGS